jgi:ATP-dependent helicase/nuclease subunit B
MPVHLLISSPATGKTRTCLERIAAAYQRAPFARVWVLVPDQLQANEFRQRLADTGRVYPARIATFSELHEEILEQAGRTFAGSGNVPVAGTVMLHRLVQAVVSSLNSAGRLAYYGPISNLPGFTLEVRDRIAELKRALVTPEVLSAAAQAHPADPGLVDLAQIYTVYQSRLQDLNWADQEGLSWLAYQALSNDQNLMTGLALLVVDGFDNFNPAQLRLLQVLAMRSEETAITLPGTLEMQRLAHRRFARVAQALAAQPAIDIQTLADAPHLPPTLDQVEAGLFETRVIRFAPGPDLDRIEARSPAEETREALRWLKGHILRDGVPIEACALAVPELDTYRGPLVAAAAEFGLPLRFSQGALLSATPAAAAVLDLLRLAPGDFPRRELLDSLRSSYFDLSTLGLHPADAKLLEIASRYGQVVQGLARWQGTLLSLASQNQPGPSEMVNDEMEEEESTAPRLPMGEEAARLLRGLHQLASRLAPPAGEIPFKDWALWLQNLLEELGFFESLARAGETDLEATFTRLLFSLARSEALTGPCPSGYAGFLKELQGLLAASTVAVDSSAHLDGEQPAEEKPAIRVLRLLEVRGVRMQALAVLGLAEGSFPIVERADPFIGEDLRRDLGMDLRLGQEQAGLFYQIVTRPNRFLLLTRPYLAKDGETWEASPYWNNLQELLQGAAVRIHPDDARPLNQAASSHELLFWAARRSSQAGLDLPEAYQAQYRARWKHISETREVLVSRLQDEAGSRYDGDLTTLAGEFAACYGPSAGWSASRLETYATCPFFFLISSTLGLEMLETPQEGYQVNQLGSLLHSVLEHVYSDTPDPANPAEVLARLPEVAGAIFETAPQVYGFRPSLLWKVQQSELMLKLAATIQNLADFDAAGQWRPLAFEAKFGMQGQPALRIAAAGGDIRLHGVIDRIDVNPLGQLRVIDYKSGGSHLTPQDLVEGRRLQLPIYALAAAQALDLGEPVEGFYWKLFQGEASSLKLSSFQCEAGAGPQAAIEMAAGYVTTIVTAIRLGQFAPLSPKGGCPSYCPATAWCWHFLPARSY